MSEDGLSRVDEAGIWLAEKDSGMTLREIGDRHDVSPSTVQKWVNLEMVRLERISGSGASSHHHGNSSDCSAPRFEQSLQLSEDGENWFLASLPCHRRRYAGVGFVLEFPSRARVIF